MHDFFNLFVSICLSYWFFHLNFNHFDRGNRAHQGHDVPTHLMKIGRERQLSRSRITKSVLSLKKKCWAHTSKDVLNILSTWKDMIKVKFLEGSIQPFLVNKLEQQSLLVSKVIWLYILPNHLNLSHHLIKSFSNSFLSKGLSILCACVCVYDGVKAVTGFKP